MSVLINISNHPSEKWSDEQKARWTKIIDIPFPNVPADSDEIATMEIAAKVIDQITKIMSEDTNARYLMIQGEFTLCYFLFEVIRRAVDVGIAIPTTERTTVETTNPDGTTTKSSVFKFVRWRII